MVEGEYRRENQEVLGWRQVCQPRLYLSTFEETTIWPPRIVITVLQPQDRIGLSIWDTKFERGRSKLAIERGS